VDKEKAALNHISEGEIIRAVQVGMKGVSIDLFHQPRDKESIDITLELPRAFRASTEGLLNIGLRSSMNPEAPLVPLRELVKVEEVPADQPIYRKNLKPVIYVTGDVAGTVESPVYAIFDMNKQLAELNPADYGGTGEKVELYNLNQPFSSAQPAMKWDGEWHITLEVFRDLGLAF
jgi:multidrug efflux pump subunit AcrB